MTDDERRGKAAMDGFYKHHPIGALAPWEDLEPRIQRCWVLAAKTAIKERDRLKWEENLAYAKEFG